MLQPHNKERRSGVLVLTREERDGCYWVPGCTLKYCEREREREDEDVKYLLKKKKKSSKGSR